MKLKEIHIKGFKSIDNHKGQTIPLGDVTVLLGANGSGKSNVVSFFKMLSFIFSKNFSEFLGRVSAESLPYYGRKRTEDIEFSVEMEAQHVESTYSTCFSLGNSENMFFVNESITYFKSDINNRGTFNFSNGQPETGLIDSTKSGYFEAYKCLTGIRAFQFHDTSDTSSMKYRSYIDDASFLRSDAKNLASFLKMLKESEKYNKYYKRIVRHIQQGMPQFGDFSLETLPPNNEFTRLNWYEKNNSEYLFSPHQISDGSLRFMALATLLLQPPDLMPSFIVIDEPELGLHPAAIAELAAMIRSASAKTQVLIATQSTLLVDEFSLENVVIVERDKENNCSVFKKYTEDELKEWLTDYSLSELWEKNVLGGKP